MKKKLNLDLACGPAIPLLEKCVHTQMWTQMFPAALFITARKGRPATWPLRDEQMNQMQSIQTREYSSALIRNEILTRATTRRNLRSVMPSERSQTWRPHVEWFHLYEVPSTGKQTRNVDECLPRTGWAETGNDCYWAQSFSLG